jgi:nucleoid-associated protein YgaU
VSAANVLIVVPDPTQPAAPPALAVLAAPAGPSRVLQAPSTQPAGPGARLALGTLDYDEHGTVRFSGSAPPNAPVRVYLDNARVGEATADRDGHWTVSPSAVVSPGMHSLRVDQITPQGRVASRVETPFQREALALSQVAAGQVVVQPGQNLWRLARRVYGNGLRYTVIFQANKDLIRDVRLIYPGQVLSVPGQDGQAAAH